MLTYTIIIGSFLFLIVIIVIIMLYANFRHLKSEVEFLKGINHGLASNLEQVNNALEELSNNVKILQEKVPLTNAEKKEVEERGKKLKKILDGLKVAATEYGPILINMMLDRLKSKDQPSGFNKSLPNGKSPKKKSN